MAASLVRLPGPFDRPEAAPTPATPSCCCSCCCLVSAATSSTVAAVSVNHAAKVSGQSDGRRRLLTSGAALVFLVGCLPFVLTRFVPDSVSDDMCEWAVAALAVGVPFGTWLLWMRFLYGAAGAPPRLAWWRSVKFAAGTALFFLVELITFGFLFWGQLLAVPVPIIVGLRLRDRLRAKG